MRALVIGIDIGTSSIKTEVLTKDFTCVKKVVTNYEYITLNDNWHEIEPQSWWKIIQEQLKEIFLEYDENEIKAIGITGQMHTTVFLDQKGRSIRPAIQWTDLRTKDILPDIQLKLNQNEKTAYLAEIVSTGSPLANVVWLKEYEPSAFNQLYKICMPVNYIVYCLTNRLVIDYCDASTTSMFDLYRGQWMMEVIQAFHLSETILPKLGVANECAGMLTKEVQQILNIKSTIPVIVGTGDNVASAFASHVFQTKAPLLSLGTSGVVVIPSDEKHIRFPGKNVFARLSKADASTIIQGTVQAGAKLNQWWLQNIIESQDVIKEQERISNHLLGENTVLFLPHLNGEKTLYHMPALRGGFLGIGLDTCREEMYLAVLEGLAFGMRKLFESMSLNSQKPKYFNMVGGGTKSELWLQIFANVFGVPMHVSETYRGAAEGVAELAMQHVGMSVINRDDTRVILPDTCLIQKYEKKYQQYLVALDLLIAYTKNNRN